MVRSAWDIACSIDRSEIRDQGFLHFRFRGAAKTFS